MAVPGQPECKLTQVCEELDQLTLQFMDDLETLANKRDLLNNMIEQGWLCLSKSRYSMGTKYVSPLQYKPDTEATVLIKDSTTEDGRTRYEVEKVDMTKRPAPLEVEEVGATEQGLRRRKGPTEPPSSTKAEEEGDGNKVPQTTPSQDPLRWFGILVPQSLRQAQSCFTEGISLAAEVASLQSSVEETRSQYHSLLAKKHHLLARES
ncbi:coiled-coil domain-containing protein 115 isoform 1-T4 [Discoglossus pictus]